MESDWKKEGWKRDYTKEAWWNCLTCAEREEMIADCEENEEEKTKAPAKFKAIDLFGWG